MSTLTGEFRVSLRFSALVLVCLFVFGQPFAGVAEVTVDTNTPPAETAPEETMTEMTAETDTTPAELVSVAEVSVEPTGTTIAWTTDELTYGLIEYGTTAVYGSVTEESAIATMSHQQTISGLEPETTYYYRIRMRDEAGNISYSAPRSFATAAEPAVADEAAPTISEVTVSNITASGASVSFTADELVRGRIEYGTSAAYGSSLPFTEEYADTHTFSLSGLAAGEEYHFRLIAEDQAGNTTTSFDETFTTLAPEPPPEAALAVSNIEVASVGTSTARIVWNTNKSADGQVFYGKTSSYGSVSAVGPIGATHSIKLSGLAPATHYYFKVVSKTTAGETSASTAHEFNTLAAPVAPVSPLPSISQVRIESVATSSVAVRWTTNLAVSSKVEYGRDTTYGSVSQNAAPVTEHYALLAPLLSATTYHLRITARDGTGNTALSKDYSFKTLAASSAPSSSGGSASVPQTDSPTAPPKDSSATTNSPTKIQPLPDPPKTLTRGGGVGLTPPTMPRLVKAEALNGQVMFVWLRNFDERPFIQVRIIRKLDAPPRHRNDGEVIFDGNGKSFTDTDLQNGTPYHYALFTYDTLGRFSPLVRISAIPKADKEEIVLKAEPRAVPLSPAVTFGGTLAVGSSGSDVLQLQALLSRYPKLYPEGFVTGYFGELTQAAVERVQKKYNLPQTGYADARTRSKLEALSLVPSVTSGERVLFSRDLSLGMRGSEVRMLQNFLAGEGLFSETATGYFGPITRESVKQFQTANNITPISGLVGPQTREAIQTVLGL